MTEKNNHSVNQLQIDPAIKKSPQTFNQEKSRSRHLWQLFGEKTDEIIEELNEVLAA